MDCIIILYLIRQEYHFITGRQNRKDEQYRILTVDSVNAKYDNKVRATIRSLLDSGTKYVKNEY
ncbi:MAG: hypothetical protein IKQ67_00550 [Candidatus Methanomethylophilaceae archaeon]|nr:hypothetical protein [Candidatus Methanomethylophilaceae archaeon]